MTAPETTLINVESTHYPPLLLRHPGNPILTRKDWPYSINSVFNAGATLLQDGTTLLLCRVEDRRGLSHLCAARSRNGVDGWQIDREPTLMPSPKDYPEEIWGIEDPRITFVPELQQYVVTYTSYSRGGPGVSLALTKDFRSFERYGVIMPPDDKDSALLPRRIDGYWALIHRPMTPLGAHMWISYSPDLRHWGRHRLMLEARRGAWWDANKIGLSPPPIETSRGWLVLYHGVRHTPSGCLYRLGLGALRSGESGKMPAARRFLDLWAGGGLRAQRRRQRCRVPLRIHHGPRWRHHQYLLRSRRLLDCPGSGQRALSAGVAGCQWKLRTPASAGRMNPLLWVFEFVFRCRHRQTEPRIHHQGENVSGLLQMRTGV